MAFDKHADRGLKKVWFGIVECYQINFLEIGIEKEHIYFFVHLKGYETYNVAQEYNIVTKEIFSSKETIMGW